MTCIARVLIVEEGDAPAWRAGDWLASHGYESIRTSPGAETSGAIESALPDIVVLNPGAPAHVPELADQIRDPAAASGLPIAVLEGSGESGCIGTDRPVVDALLPRDCSGQELISRLGGLVRLATMRAELSRRIETARKYGVSEGHWIARERGAVEGTVLISGADAERREALGRTLGAVGTVLHAAEYYQALTTIQTGDVDAVCVCAGGAADDALEFVRDVRTNPRLFDLPLMVLAPAGLFADDADPIVAGASDYLPEAAPPARIRAHLATLLNQRRYVREMRAINGRKAHTAMTDALTGLFNHGFLHEHLDLTIEDSFRRNKELTVGVVNVASMPEVNEAFGYAAGDIVLRQIGQAIDQLVRNEDVVGRLSGSEFCILLPETNVEAAMQVVHRVMSVITNTEFLPPTAMETAAVQLDAGLSVLISGDTTKSLMGRARPYTKGPLV